MHVYDMLFAARYVVINIRILAGAESLIKPAAHESYLLSKYSLVTIGVSTFPASVRRHFESFCSRVPGENSTCEQKHLKCRRTVGELVYAKVTSEVLLSK